MNSTDFEKIRLPLNFNLDNVYATGYAIKIENSFKTKGIKVIKDVPECNISSTLIRKEIKEGKIK